MNKDITLLCVAGLCVAGSFLDERTALAFCLGYWIFWLYMEATA